MRRLISSLIRSTVFFIVEQGHLYSVVDGQVGQVGVGGHMGHLGHSVIGHTTGASHTPYCKLQRWWQAKMLWSTQSSEQKLLEKKTFRKFQIRMSIRDGFGMRFSRIPFPRSRDFLKFKGSEFF